MAASPALMDFARPTCFTTEEELTAEVGQFNAVVVGHCHFSSITAETHQSERLEVLTAQGSTSNEEGLLTANSPLYIRPEDGDLMVVTGGHWSGVGGDGGGEEFEGIEMKPLSDGSVLTRLLSDFLCDDSAKEGTQWRELRAGVETDLANDDIVHFHSAEGGIALVGGDDGASDGNESVRILEGMEARQGVLLPLKIPQGETSDVELKIPTHLTYTPTANTNTAEVSSEGGTEALTVSGV